MNQLQGDFQNLPRAIWMPAPLSTMPACYQGHPLEMVQAMAQEMKPGLGVHDAIDQLVRMLADSRHIQIRLPEGPEEHRAVGFVAALLLTGVAKPMASA